MKPHDDAVDELLAHVDEDLDIALGDALDIEAGLARAIPEGARHRAQYWPLRRGFGMVQLRDTQGTPPPMAGAAAGSGSTTHRRTAFDDDDTFDIFTELPAAAPPIIG